jgi:hypothetical protein
VGPEPAAVPEPGRSRIYFRGKTPNGFYWKTFDIFTGQLTQ